MSANNISALGVAVIGVVALVAAVVYAIAATDPVGEVTVGLLGLASTCVGVLAKSPVGPDEVQVVNAPNQPVPVEDNNG